MHGAEFDCCDISITFGDDDVECDNIECSDTSAVVCYLDDVVSGTNYPKVNLDK